MVQVVIIARKNDGTIFCEFTKEDVYNDKNLMTVRNRAIDFLKNLQTKNDLCTVNIDSQKYVFQYIFY